MQVKNLTITNIGKIESISVNFDKPLLLFYGEVQQGKTTILNAIRFVFGGSFPSDILRHGTDEGSVCLTFDNGSITRELYRAKDGTTKSRPVVFIRDGKPVAKPVAEIEKFLNPFLLDQDFLRNKTELERKRYFAELFHVDTTDIDAEAARCEEQARELRAKLKGYGEIDLTPVEAVDVTELRRKRAEIQNAHDANIRKFTVEFEAELAAVRADNREREEHNRIFQKTSETLSAWCDEIKRLEAALKNANDKVTEIGLWLAENKQRPLLAEPTLALPAAPNACELDEEISQAAATNVRAEQYRKNVQRDAARKTDESQLAELEAKLRGIRQEKVNRLKDISDSCGIPGLAFDERGNFIYEGTEAGMLSTSQVMKLSSDLSSLYSQGFGLDLIDRAESLGKSIFGFVQRAEREKKTILATIVGECPATVPVNVGVFVVEDGKVCAAAQ